MKFREITSGMVIHCSTEEEIRTLLIQLERMGYSWNSGHLPTEYNRIKNWNCFFLKDNRISAENYRNLAHDNECKITEFSDLLFDSEIQVQETAEGSIDKEKIDKEKQFKMSAIEILKWLAAHEGTEAMYDLFKCYYTESIWLYDPQEIVDRITAYEAQQREKGEKT